MAVQASDRGVKWNKPGRSILIGLEETNEKKLRIDMCLLIGGGAVLNDRNAIGERRIKV